MKGWEVGLALIGVALLSGALFTLLDRIADLLREIRDELRRR